MTTYIKKDNCLKCELEVAGSDLGSDQLSTGATLMGTGTSDSVTTPDNVDYIALHTGASTVPNGLNYINGFDQAAGASGVIIDLNTPIDVTGVTEVEYCFYLYNAQDPDQSSIVDSASRYKSYSITPKDVVIETDAGNVTAQYTLTTDDIDNALFLREWLQVCVTATLPAGATQITQIAQILEHLGGTSGADFDQTREVFAIAPATIRATPTPSCKSVCEHLQDLFDRVGEIEKTGASDDQEILVSISGTDVTFEIEGGNSQTVDFSAFVSDPDVFVVSFINDGTDIVLTMSDGSELSVPLASLPDEDQQVLSIVGNDISISNGNTITIPVDTDTQNTVSAGENVTVTPSVNLDGTTNFEVSANDQFPVGNDGDILTYDVSTGTWIPSPLPLGIADGDDVDDADNDPTNEIQELNLVLVPQYEYSDNWAEEGGAMSDGVYQFSWGNGAVGGKGLPFSDGWEIYEAYIQADVGGNAVESLSIDIVDMRTLTIMHTIQINQAGDGTDDNAHYLLDARNAPLGITDDAVVGFRTNDEVGTWQDVIVGFRARRETGLVLGQGTTLV